MDRTAWIVVAFCIAGLVLWEVYSFKQVQQARPVGLASPAATASPAVASPGPLTSTVTPTAATPSPNPPAPVQPSPSAASFAEVTDTIRNSDLELHLTN